MIEKAVPTRVYRGAMAELKHSGMFGYTQGRMLISLPVNGFNRGQIAGNPPRPWI